MAAPAVYPGVDLYPAGDLFPQDQVLPVLPPADGRTATVSPLLVHVGDLLSGLITATIPVVGMSWTDTLNGSGSINVTVTEDVARAYDLRQLTHGVRSFLAVEQDGRIKAAGPIWSRTWDWEQGQLTLGASGLWSYFDHRIIRPVVWNTAKPAAGVFTVTGKSLGGIARAIVERVIGTADYSSIPVVLPPDEAGTHTESFPVWKVLKAGDQLREITQRDTAAPDVRFVPRRRGDDPRYLEWVMEVGTEAKPGLSQGGPDWVFDSSSPKSPVLGISTDEDATDMAQQVWLTGNGSEEDILLSVAFDPELLNKGWALVEVEESRSTVEQQDTLNGHAFNSLAQSNRPIEAFKVTVRSDAAREVQAGDYCRLITRGDVWLGDLDKTMRVRQVSGGLGDDYTLEMFPMAASL